MIPVMSQKQVRENLRTRAHRTILTAAINAALAQRIIGRRNGENFWPGASESKEHVFRFTFASGIPAAAYIHDLGQELAFHVALWPNGDLNRLAASNAGSDAGEAFVVGWLTIHFFMKLIGKIQLGYFAIYRWVIAALMLWSIS